MAKGKKTIIFHIVFSFKLRIGNRNIKLFIIHFIIARVAYTDWFGIIRNSVSDGPYVNDIVQITIVLLGIMWWTMKKKMRELNGT